ncbi:MAG: hypothetical protein IJ248_03535, partial [Candidatus Methanomethylophilaceae archaeon]|nr:hypothetical protein [Candidatus Methanomethylophilaceae archaeon]
MNTKGTKFLAVLAVFAMMFAGFATVVASENFDAVDSEDTTIETNISEYTSQATVIIPKGSLDSDIEMLIKAQSTMPVSSNFEFTGHSYNNKVSGYGYNNAIYNGYAVVYLTLNLKDWVGSSTDK